MKKLEAKLRNKADNKITIFGVKISGTSTSSVLRKIEDFLAHKHKFLVVTPNPEILLKAERDVLLRKILNKADISIPDGFGMKLLYGLDVIHGRELFIDLLKILDRKRGRVYLLGGSLVKSENTRSLKHLSRTFKGLSFKGTVGPGFNDKGIPVAKKDEEAEVKVLKEINAFKPDMLFVGFGAPKQEKWVYRNWDKLQVGGVMVVGRTFEYFSGKYPLPPALMDKLGLEWLWRLATGSTNIKRIWKAVVVFPLRVMFGKN